jgi:SAM-dependent methyltransferase
MGFKSVEDVLRHLESSDWGGAVEHENALEVALSPLLIDDIFERSSSGTECPVIVVSGCGAGQTGAEIQHQLEERNLTEYQLYIHDIRESVLGIVQNKFAGDPRVSARLRTGFDFSEFEDGSVDGIFSFDCMLPLLNDCYLSGEQGAHEFFLRESSRVLREGKPLALTHRRFPLLMVKNSKKRKMPLEVRRFEYYEEISPFLDLLGVIGPIKDEIHIKNVVEEGFEVRGPRGDSSKDVVSFQRILKTGREFVPEPWLVSQGYQVVEPSPFTQGKRILWKEKDDFPDEYASSNYSLVGGGEEIALYLKVELPNLGE